MFRTLCFASVLVSACVPGTCPPAATTTATSSATDPVEPEEEVVTPRAGSYEGDGVEFEILGDGTLFVAFAEGSCSASDCSGTTSFEPDACEDMDFGGEFDDLDEIEEGWSTDVAVVDWSYSSLVLTFTWKVDRDGEGHWLVEGEYEDYMCGCSSDWEEEITRGGSATCG